MGLFGGGFSLSSFNPSQILSGGVSVFVRNNPLFIAAQKAAQEVERHSIAVKIIKKNHAVITGGLKAAGKAASSAGASVVRVAAPVAAVVINYTTYGLASPYTSKAIEKNKSLGGGSSFGAAVGSAGNTIVETQVGLTAPAATVAVGYVTLGASAGVTSRLSQNEQFGGGFGGGLFQGIANKLVESGTVYGGVSETAVGAAYGDRPLNFTDAAGIVSAGAGAAGYSGVATAASSAGKVSSTYTDATGKEITIIKGPRGSRATSNLHNARKAAQPATRPYTVSGPTAALVAVAAVLALTVLL